MSWHHVHHVRKASPLTGALYAVHRSLADFADDDGICWPSHKALAQDARVSRRSVIDALQALEDLELLARQRTRGKYNSYRLALVPWDGCTDCTSSASLSRCAEAALVQPVHRGCAATAPESPENPQKDPDPDPRAGNAYPPARGQSGTSPHPAILPETPDVPDVQEGCSVGRLPQAAALSAKAAQPEAPASVAEAEGTPPAPEHHPVSASPTAGAAPTSGALAERLAASPGGAFRGSRAEGAYTRAAPPPAEFGHTYRLAWEDGPPEVGQARTVRGTGLYSPGFMHLLKTRYGEDFAYA